jgi:type I restriction enzyme, S subunit
MNQVNIFDIFEYSCSISKVGLDNITNGDFRLDSSFFIDESNILVDSNLEFEPLKSIASVVFPGIFKRFLVESPAHGIGFLTTSEMMMIEPAANKFLSIDLTKNLEIYRVSEHTLLVSRSGSIGNTMYVNKDLINYAITEDALRVKPFDEKQLGFLYFYFTNEYGKGLITGQKSGAVIDHIYEENLLNLPIPKVEGVDYFHVTFQRIKNKREKANELLKKARHLVLQYNNLPNLEETEMDMSDSEREMDIRTVSTREFTSDFRLDAHFNNPVAKTAITNIKEYALNYQTLNELSNDIIIGKRFKRIYVEPNHGTPFIGSKQTLQIRPIDLKYLSNTEINFMENLLLQKGMILIACSGSLGGSFGKVSFVWRNFENYAASQHILRVVCNEELVDSGYLYAFLSSEYGYLCITRYRWGALIDEIDDKDISKIEIPIPSRDCQKEIGTLVRKAYDFRAEAIQLENESQEILTKALTGN